MSDYLKDLYTRATEGIELAGDDFTAEINIDCRNVITMIKKIDQQAARIDELERIIESSIIHFEASESPFYEGIKILKGNKDG